jgi:glycosyltransferase involved in cell wall biosynthesis
MGIRELDKMKIIHVADYYQPEISGFLKESTTHLAERGHDVTIFASNIVHIFSDEHRPPPQGVKVRRFWGKRIGERAICPSLPLALLKEKADVIHAYGLGYFSGFAAGYARKLNRTPLLLRADFNTREEITPFRALFNKFWKSVPLSTADAVTVHTNYMKGLLQQNYKVDPSKVEVLSHGIDFRKFSQKIKKSDVGLDGKFVVLNVSRADPSKDPLKIIKALPALKKVCNDFVFVHIGPYYDAAYHNILLETAKSLRVQDNIILKGKLPHNDIIKFYNAADVYVQSSAEESFGLSTLEAMAAGLPVIATKTGAIGYEWLDSYDYWFSDPSALGEKLVTLYSDRKKREELGLKLQGIAKGYDWSVNIKRLENIYEKIKR